MSITKIYIAGPMTGIPDFNFPAFREASATLRSLGLHVTSPHEVTEESDGIDAPREKPWSFYMRNSLRAMLDCDRVLMLPGWEMSKGAIIEHRVAHELCMPVYYSIGSVFAGEG